MMKVLDYDKVNGTQDRDDTILIAKIIPRPDSSSGGSTAATVVENDEGKENGTANYFVSAKDIVVGEVMPGSGPMSPVMSTVGGYKNPV